MDRLDRIEAMLGEILRRGAPPESLGRLWAAFPWLRPSTQPSEPVAMAAWLSTGPEGDL